MVILLPSHMCRNRHGSLYFRLSIPPDLRSAFTTSEIYRSLRATSVRDAAPTAQALTIAFRSLFNRLRREAMPDHSETPVDAFEEFKNLPDVLQRIREAGQGQAAMRPSDPWHSPSDVR